MLPIKIKAVTLFNEATEEFIEIPNTTLNLEHSLLSVAKWEAKTHKCFLDTLEKRKLTPEGLMYYIECMTLNQGINKNVYQAISEQQLKSIVDYINDSHTATWFREDQKDDKEKKNKRPVTAELIYCWMIELRMDTALFQKWHLNRLLTLINVINEENKAQMPKQNGKIDMNKRRNLMQQRRSMHKPRMH